ncbi:ribbon-helix-helix protein, CopG family [Phormidesmis priestleyi]
MTSKEIIQIRLPKEEKQRVDSYCQKAGRSITDVLREFIRSLPER